MRNHRKVKALRKKFKNGYSIWCMTLEYLSSCEGNKFLLNDIELEFLAGDFEYESVEIKEVYDYCLRIHLLFENDGFLHSKTMDERFSSLYSKRHKERVIDNDNKITEELSPPIIPQNEDYRQVIDDESTHSIVEYSIAYYSKSNKELSFLTINNHILAAALSKNGTFKKEVGAYFLAKAASEGFLDFKLSSETSKICNKLVLQQVKQPTSYIDEWVDRLKTKKQLHNGKKDTKGSSVPVNQRDDINFTRTIRKS
jgi:hypothetical protein